MRILFLSHRFFPDIGGIEVNSAVLAREFAVAGHEIRLATWSKDAASTEFLFSVIRCPSVIELARQHRWADVVYENNICLRLSCPAVVLGKPSVIALRTWVNRMDGSVGIQDRVKRLWLRRAKGVIAISERVRQRCWSDAEVIGNPYRADLFGLNAEIPRDRDFVFLGRLVSDKGADLALRAIHALANLDPQCKHLTLSIVGDGPERNQLERLAEQLGVSRRVHFTGNLQGVALVNYLNHHRFLWVPSRWEEPFGNVALEGMACGCISIVSDGGGLPDAVGNAGVMFKRGDLEDMVQQTRRLLNDQDLQSRLRDAAGPHLENHRPENVARRYLDVIEKAVQG